MHFIQGYWRFTASVIPKVLGRRIEIQFILQLGNDFIFQERPHLVGQVFIHLMALVFTFNDSFEILEDQLDLLKFVHHSTS